jgi:hypothetical protein
MDEKDLEKHLKKFLNSRELEKKIKDSVDKQTKDDKEMEKFVVEITKNVLVQLYKTMWTRKSFWVSSIKNKST